MTLLQGAGLAAGAAMPRRWLGAVIAAGLLLSACRPEESSRHGEAGRPDAGPCLHGGRSCALADVPPGHRAVLRGHRMVRLRWLPRRNRESGVPDVGLQAEWAPLLDHR
ncbi:MAG: hypothetical protein ACKOXO_11065 [Cyanobium sp.]